MGYFAAHAITLFLVALVLITVINGGVQRVIYFPCTHGTKSVLNLGTQHYKTQQKLVETISFNGLLSALFRMQISVQGLAQGNQGQRLAAGHRADADALCSSMARWTRSPLQPAVRVL